MYRLTTATGNIIFIILNN